MARRATWGLFGLLLALSILGIYSDYIAHAFGDQSRPVGLLRLLFPDVWGREPLTATAGRLAPPLFLLAAVLILGGLSQPASSVRLWRLPPEARHAWRESLAALVLAKGALTTVAGLIQLMLAPLGRSGLFSFGTFQMGNLLIGIGALLCGWLLLFGRAESTSRRWIGFLTAAVTVALLAWLLWGAAGQSMLGASLLGMPFGMQILFPTGIFIYAAIIWVGLALARALVIGDPAVVPPASHAARGRLLLAALLVVVCFQQLALGGMYYHGLALLLAAPFLVAIGYLGLIQLVQALGALGLTHSTAVPTIYRRHLNRWMIVLLALFGLGPVIIFAGCVLLLGLMFGGAHFN